MTTAKSFHLGDILSVTHECLVSPRHMDGIYDLLNWMTSDNLFTHQLPRAAEECKPHLLAQHPDLTAVQMPDFSVIRPERVKAWVEEWLARQVVQFGEYRDVTPLAADEHTQIDPLTELAMNHPQVKVVAVELPVAES